MLKMENVPYRKWGSGRYKGKLVECPEGKRVMALMGKEMKAGKAIDFSQSHPLNDGIDETTGKFIPHPSGVYDTISLTITD